MSLVDNAVMTCIIEGGFDSDTAEAILATYPLLGRRLAPREQAWYLRPNNDPRTLGASSPLEPYRRSIASKN